MLGGPVQITNADIRENTTTKHHPIGTLGVTTDGRSFRYAFAGGTTLVKSGTYNPENFIVYQNELYFGANSGNEFWKTDGTTTGTVMISATSFNKATIFANKMFFTTNGKLWKSDGTAAGTTLVMDSAGNVTGANSNFLFTSYMKSLTVSPYFEILLF